MVGQYRSAGITLTDTQVAKLQLDSAGNLKTVSAGTGATADKVQGNVASAATDSGNPIKMGGKYSASPAGVTDGQRTDAWFGAAGSMGTFITNLAGVQVPVLTMNVDGTVANTTAALEVAAFGLVFNGTTWDRVRGNINATQLTAAAVTTTQTGADQTNVNGRGVIVVLDMTTVGTGSVTITIQGKDAASGKYFTLLAGAAVVTNSTNTYTVYPGAPATANVSANAPLPATWRVLVTANNANATTYTVGSSVIV